MYRPSFPTRYLAAVFACWLILAPSGANALTLGNLVARSNLGEPLHAEIAVRMGPNESVDETCITLPRPSNAPDDLPYLSKARFSVTNLPSGQVIHIRSTQIINEPALKILLQVSCSGQASLSREFTLLLEPASYTGPAPIVENEAAQPSQIEAEPLPQPGTTWEIRPGVTLADIARAAYPDSPARQHRLEQAIAAANPNIFSGDIAGDLPVGQTLRIPELPAPKRTTKRSTTTSTPKTPIRRHSAPTETFQLKLSTGEIDLSVSRNMTEEDRIKLREKQLLLEADDQVANILALKNQVKALESRLSELSLSMSMNTPNPAPLAKPQIAHKAALPAQPAKHTSSLTNFWFGLGLLGILLGLYLTIRRHRRHNRALEQFQLDQHFDTESEKPEFTPVKQHDMPATGKTATEDNHYNPHSIFTPPDKEIILTEMDSVVEEADLYLIYGWTDKAIDLLQGYIAKHPQEIQPWVMLFDIYRSQGKKEVFEKLAHRFKETFSDDEQWRKVQALGRELDPRNNLYFSAAKKTNEAIANEPDNQGAAKGDRAEQKPEMESVVEEADLYLVYGWTNKAIDLLQGYIAKHPQEPQPWIMLFDIYRSQGKKEAFDKLAHRFKETFSDADLWRKIQALGNELDSKNNLYSSATKIGNEANTKPEDDFWAHSKTDFKPKPKK